MSVVEQAKQGRLSSSRLPSLPPEQHAGPSSAAHHAHPDIHQDQPPFTSSPMLAAKLPPLAARHPASFKKPRPLSAAPTYSLSKAPAAAVGGIADQALRSRPVSAKKLRPLSGTPADQEAAAMQQRIARWQQLLLMLQQTPDNIEFVYLKHVQPGAKEFNPFDVEVCTHGQAVAAGR